MITKTGNKINEQHPNRNGKLLIGFQVEIYKFEKKALIITDKYINRH